MNDLEKGALSVKTIEAFLKQFGDPSDLITQVTLEVLFEELFGGNKNIHILGESKQEGDKTNSNNKQ